MIRQKPTLIDLADDLDNALKPWKCPECKRTYKPPLTTYINPIDGRERCEKCASACNE